MAGRKWTKYFHFVSLSQVGYTIPSTKAGFSLLLRYFRVSFRAYKADIKGPSISTLFLRLGNLYQGKTLKIMINIRAWDMEPISINWYCSSWKGGLVKAVNFRVERKAQSSSSKLKRKRKGSWFSALAYRHRSTQWVFPGYRSLVLAGWLAFPSVYEETCLCYSLIYVITYIK